MDPSSIDLQRGRDFKAKLEELPPTDESTPPAKKVQKVVNTPVVDNSGVRRSLRIREKKDGFNEPSCATEGCLACSANPPNLSLAEIKSIGEKTCMMAPGTITGEVLLSKPKLKSVIGLKLTPKKIISKNVPKGKKKNNNNSDDDDEETN
ncbi:hypothetical protein C2845_PM10G13900 [Panicum miliaceum]|uniref:Uncharacterized protein n=1 Tax=Panicum miliaceum TaxID=4540 RepID=A0A3L6PEQ9_PANMI|nr:hypothetical protein C2845_PM10G13900 [Panicum miliaceum]